MKRKKMQGELNCIYNYFYKSRSPPVAEEIKNTHFLLTIVHNSKRRCEHEKKNNDKFSAGFSISIFK